MTSSGDGSKRKIGTQTQKFVHCNFGWGGSKDGYYVPKIFDTAAGPIIRENSKGPGDYSNKVEIITYSSPIK